MSVLVTKQHMTVLHTTKEINVNEIRIDLGSFSWHAPKPLHTSTSQQKVKTGNSSGTWYSAAYMSQVYGQKRFIIMEATADWRDLMIHPVACKLQLFPHLLRVGDWVNLNILYHQLALLCSICNLQNYFINLITIHNRETGEISVSLTVN